MTTSVGYAETNQSNNLPDWYNNLYQSLLTQGKQYAGQQTSPYTGQLTAGFTPQQNQAGQMLQSSLGGWQPAYQQGLGQIQQSTNWNPAMQQQFLNPYMGGVVNEIARLGNENFRLNTAPTIADQFTSLGQFGSARQAQALGTAASKTQAEISGQQSQALSNAYNQAAQQYGNWGQLGMQGGQGLIAGAGSGQTFGNTDTQSLFGYGTQAQQTQQNALNAQYQEWLRQQTQPMTTLGQWGTLFGQGKLPTQQTTTGTTGSFKKGGLVALGKTEVPQQGLVAAGRKALLGTSNQGKKPLNFATGGWVLPEDSWQITPEMQKEADRKRMILLTRELRDNPGDKALEKEVLNEDAKGNMLADRGGEEPPLQLAEALPDLFGRKSDAPSPVENFMQRRMQLAQDLFQQKRDLAERVRTDPNFQQIQEPDLPNRLGEAMLEAGAQGPANIGQLIGRTGASYYGNRDLLRKENEQRAKTGLDLEQKLQDKLSSAMTGLGGAGGNAIKTVNIGNGRVMKIFPDGSEEVVSVAPFMKEINTRAAEEAAELMKNVTTPLGVKERAEMLQKLFEQRRAVHMKAYGIQDDGSTPGSGGGGVPGAGLPVAPKPGESGSILTKSQEKEQEGMGKNYSEQYDNYIKEGAKGTDQLAQIHRLEGYLDQINAGKITEMALPISQFANSAASLFGFEPIDKKLGPKEAAIASASQMALSLVDQMKGSLSDKDREYVQAMQASIGKSPAANKLILESMKAMAQRKQELADLADKWFRDNKTMVGFQAYKNKWVKDHPMFDKAPSAEPLSREELLQKYLVK